MPDEDEGLAGALPSSEEPLFLKVLSFRPSDVLSQNDEKTFAASSSPLENKHLFFRPGHRRCPFTNAISQPLNNLGAAFEFILVVKIL